jgi:hypothetical protein
MSVPYYRIDLSEVPETYSNERLVRVVPSSPKLLRRAVQEFALCFSRELHYAIQFGYTDNSPYAAYLFSNWEGPLPRVWIGACCFRPIALNDFGPQRESLKWIWIHPYFRNQDVLSELWPGLRANHEDFHLEEPISPAMKGFLSKNEKNFRLTKTRQIGAQATNRGY